jgi:membrane protein
LVLVGVLSVFFRYASTVRHRWYGVFPGAAFAVTAIIGVSVGLSWFVSQSMLQVRWLTYGAIGTVIVLLFWAFMIGLMVLIGAQINAVICRAVEAKRDGGKRDEAENAPGEEGPDGELIESPHHD